jgi:hypothetical protein
MATSTLVQFLGPGEAADTSNRSKIETFLAAGTINAGDWLAFDVSKTGADKALYVVGTPGTAGRGNVVGVALAAASTGENVDAVIGGYVKAAKVAAGTAAQASLTTSATVGTAVTYATGTHTGTGPSGVALTGEVAGLAECWVFSKF